MNRITLLHIQDWGREINLRILPNTSLKLNTDIPRKRPTYPPNSASSSNSRYEYLDFVVFTKLLKTNWVLPAEYWAFLSLMDVLVKVQGYGHSSIVNRLAKSFSYKSIALRLFSWSLHILSVSCPYGALHPNLFRLS